MANTTPQSTPPLPSLPDPDRRRAPASPRPQRPLQVQDEHDHQAGPTPLANPPLPIVPPALHTALQREPPLLPLPQSPPPAYPQDLPPRPAPTPLRRNLFSRLFPARGRDTPAYAVELREFGRAERNRDHGRVDGWLRGGERRRSRGTRGLDMRLWAWMGLGVLMMVVFWVGIVVYGRRRREGVGMGDAQGSVG